MKKSFLCFIIILMISLSGCSSSTSSNEESLANNYLISLLKIDINSIDIGNFSQDNLEEEVKKMMIYLDTNFKSYFTERGYTRFLNNEIYRLRIRYFKMIDVSKINDIEINLVLYTKEEDTIAYDYTAEYVLVDPNLIEYKLQDKGQLVLKKDTNGEFKIETDYTNYDKVFIY